MLQRLPGDGRAGLGVHVEELTPGVGSARRLDQGTAGAPALVEAVEVGIAICLQYALEPGQMRQRPLAPAVGGKRRYIGLPGIRQDFLRVRGRRLHRSGHAPRAGRHRSPRRVRHRPGIGGPDWHRHPGRNSQGCTRLRRWWLRHTSSGLTRVHPTPRLHTINAIGMIDTFEAHHRLNATHFSAKLISKGTCASLAPFRIDSYHRVIYVWNSRHRDAVRYGARVSH